MEQLADTVEDVFEHFKWNPTNLSYFAFVWNENIYFSIKSAIGFGIGVGANVLTRFAVS